MFQVIKEASRIVLKNNEVTTLGLYKSAENKFIFHRSTDSFGTQELIDFFQQCINWISPKMNCIVCGKQVTTNFVSDTLESSCWNDAVVDTFEGGYGSKHDTQQYTICVCDECLDKGLIDGRVMY